MRIVNARMKMKEHFPPQEFCCEVAEAIILGTYGLKMKIDLDDQADYSGATGHCNQPLNYRRAVKVVEHESHESVQSNSYVPFDLIDIAEAEL
jgi:hypothetical protein